MGLSWKGRFKGEKPARIENEVCLQKLGVPWTPGWVGAGGCPWGRSRRAGRRVRLELVDSELKLLLVPLYGEGC